MNKNIKPDFSKLSLGTKKDIPAGSKSTDLDTAVQKIHQAETEKVETSRVSLDTPVPMLKQIKRRMLDQDIKTIRDYFLELARKDLEEAGLIRK